MGNKCEENLKVGAATIKAAEKYKGQEGAVMMALHEVQNAYGYISEDNQKYLSKELNVPLSEIYGIITFYNRFSLTPKGKYNIQVCLGTACHVQGAQTLFDLVKEKLGIEDGQTTEDGLFSLEGVRCLGACGLAPAIVVNSEVYGKVTPKKLEEIIAEYREKK
ncbi:MAG: NADH-quinone oxidoreductase subunit NuoE [Clostridia bacterium]|nr:NADH-quinone oxidoreductase subunit NuoE [Clostridia bacterium]